MTVPHLSIKVPKSSLMVFLDVFCTQPAPLVFHQQTQDIQSDICQGSVCTITNTQQFETSKYGCVKLE